MGYKEQMRNIIVMKVSDGTLRNIVAGALYGTVKASVEVNTCAKKTYEKFLSDIKETRK